MLIAVYLGMSFIVAIAAQNHRGRSGTPWFLLSLIVSPLIAGLLLLASKDRRTVSITVRGDDPRSPLGKTCPRCAEDVKLDAKVCRYCQHEFI